MQFELLLGSFLGHVSEVAINSTPSSLPIEPGKDSYSLSPTLPAEMLKAPFGPHVAGRIAFFFGPIAGAWVSVISLRRMGFPIKAKRVLRWTLLVSALMAIILILIPEALGRLIGIGAEIAFYMIYPKLQEKEFGEWQTAHPEIQPSSGWGAMGWGFLGIIMFLVIFFAVAFLLGMFFPSLG